MSCPGCSTNLVVSVCRCRCPRCGYFEDCSEGNMPRIRKRGPAVRTLLVTIMVLGMLAGCSTTREVTYSVGYDLEYDERDRERKHTGKVSVTF